MGYRALRQAAAWLDLTGHGVIRARGEDRARLLHAMTTNHIEQLRPGEGCYAFFLNAQGRILADVILLCLADHFLLDTEPETRRKVVEHLDKHIIADDVSLEDASDSTAVLGVEGPAAEEALAAAGAPVPAAPYSHAPWGARLVARISSTGAGGFRIYSPFEGKAALIAELEAAGAAAASAEAARLVRLELGKPRYGEDISEKHLPQETQLLHAVHFNKGCYLGQEIVERVRSRGAVHRFLVQLEIDAAAPPEPGAKITAEGREAGEITSAVYSPHRGCVVALGYLRLGEMRAESALAVGAAPAWIISRKPLAE